MSFMAVVGNDCQQIGMTISEHHDAPCQEVFLIVTTAKLVRQAYASTCCSTSAILGQH